MPPVMVGSSYPGIEGGALAPPSERGAFPRFILSAPDRLGKGRERYV